jgi:hypothetical protein
MFSRFLMRRQVLSEREDRRAKSIEVATGKKLAIVGAVFLLVCTPFTRVGTGGGMFDETDVILPFIRLNMVIGWFLLLMGLLKLAEELDRGPVRLALVVGFGGSAILYTMLLWNVQPSLLYCLPLYVFVGILIPALFLRIGTAFNSAILRRGGVLLFLSAILFWLTEYLPEALGSLQAIASVVSQITAAIAFVLVLWGLALLKVIASAEQEPQTKELGKRLPRQSCRGIASLVISVSATIPMYYLLRVNSLSYPLRLSTAILVFVPSVLNLVGIGLGIAGMGSGDRETHLSTVGVVLNGTLLGIAMTSALWIVTW